MSHQYQGLNSRLDEIQAAVLRVKLKKIEQDIEKRRQVAAAYLNGITNKNIILPFVANHKGHVWHLFVIRSKNRDDLQQYLADHGIQTLIHYPIPPHKQKAYAAWNTSSFPITEQIHQEVLSLPISPLITKEEVHLIVNMINHFGFI